MFLFKNFIIIYALVKTYKNREKREQEGKYFIQLFFSFKYIFGQQTLGNKQ